MNINNINIYYKKRVLKNVLNQINKNGETFYFKQNKKNKNAGLDVIASYPESSKKFLEKATEKMLMDYCNKNNSLMKKEISLEGLESYTFHRLGMALKLLTNKKY